MGIGEAAARLFAKQGGRAVIASRDGAQAEAVCASIGDAGGTAIHVGTDVSRDADVTELMALTLKEFGRLDVLVNNAGIYMQGDVAATARADWDTILAVNLTGAFLCSKYAVDPLSESR